MHSTAKKNKKIILGAPVLPFVAAAGIALSVCIKVPELSL